MQKPLYWIIILGVVAILLYFIVDRWFPYLIGKSTGFIVGLFAVVTGLFLRKKRT
jgi:hypothetical protein